jgi:hypothetical protein
MGGGTKKAPRKIVQPGRKDRNRSKKMEGIVIANDGEKIVSTNFWNTDTCRGGKFFLSINAGAYRLLLPPQLKYLNDIITANAVIISRGPWVSEGRSDGIELLFEDGSDNPFCLFAGVESVERFPLDGDQGWKGKFYVYTGPGEPVVSFSSVYYRRVKKIPWLKRVE